jgi:hypothetical protein
MENLISEYCELRAESREQLLAISLFSIKEDVRLFFKTLSELWLLNPQSTSALEWD